MKITNKFLKPLVNNKNINYFVKGFLILYSCLLIDSLDNSVLNILNNVIVKALILLLVVLLAKQDVGLSILLAIAFIANMCRRNMEGFQSEEIDASEVMSEEVMSNELSTEVMSEPEETNTTNNIVTTNTNNIVTTNTNNIKSKYDESEENTLINNEDISEAVIPVTEIRQESQKNLNPKCEDGDYARKNYSECCSNDMWKFYENKHDGCET